MPRPAEFLDWTDGSASKVVDPPGAKKLAGWTVESPPFQYMNWLFYQTDLWLKYFDTVVGGSAVDIAAAANVLSTTGDITIGSYQVLNLASINFLQDGMLVTGAGIPAGTYVVSHGLTSAILSKPATSNLVTNPLVFKHGIASLLNIQRQLDQLDAYSDLITVPVVLGTTSDITSGSYNMTNVASTAGLLKGQLIVRAGVPVGTVIRDITGATIVMSQKSTATNAAQETTFTHGYATTQGKVGIDQLDSQLYVNMGPGTQGFATISATADLTGAFIGQVVKLNSQAGAFNLNLPNPLICKNKIIVLQDDTGFLDTNNVTLVRFASEQIQKLAANYVLAAPYGSWYLWSDGVDFFFLS